MPRSTCVFFYFIIDERETVERTDDDTRVVIIDQVAQLCRWVAILHRLYGAIHMVEAKNGFL